MNIRQSFKGFQLDNNVAIADEIRFECLSKLNPFVFEFQNRLSDKRYALKTKFDLKTFLINRLGKTAAF